MSHGISRTRQSKQDIEARKQKEKAKLDNYLALTADVIAKKKAHDYNREAFDLSTRLLQINPEFYTIWNYRRIILIQGIFPSSSPEEINDLLSSDLSLTTTALKQHPKVYWIWNHRRWCLENVPEGPGGDGDALGWRKKNWDRELYVVEKMLDVDARNFHAWNYRRYVLASMPVKRPVAAEIGYTTQKIESNFSNFSAWHQRSKVFATLWDSGELNEAKSKEQEFELVQNALYTAPDDQSGWLYHRWLIGSGKDAGILQREIQIIQELLDEQPDSKWCMESLVQYKRLLLRNHAAVLGDDGRACAVRQCADLLSRLEALDPARARRYQEIATAVEAGV